MDLHLCDIAIPASVNKIGIHAFYGTPWLERFSF